VPTFTLIWMDRPRPSRRSSRQGRIDSLVVGGDGSERNGRRLIPPPNLFVISNERNQEEDQMKNTKFLVKVNRGGTRAPAYVQRIDRTPIQMTSQRVLALVMGRFTAEDAVKSIQTARCSPELVPVLVNV